MDPNQNKSGAPTLVIMAFVMGVVGVAVQKEPLKSSRPATLKSFSSENTGLQDVDARLWQDPLLAIKNIEHGTSLTPSIEATHEHNKTHSFESYKASHKLNKEVTYLGVTARWGPYLEDQEHRRRLRYAVLAGLGASDYIPDDPNHIGYLHSANSLYPEYIPFETLSNDSGEEVVLLWLDNSYFNRPSTKKGQPEGPLKYSALVSELTPQNTSKNKIHLKMIGPTGSGSLLNWLQTIRMDESKTPSCTTENLTGIPQLDIYSPYATAPSELLYELIKKGFNQEEDFKICRDIPIKNDAIQKIRINLLRTITNDYELVKDLIIELRARGIDLKCKEADCLTNTPKMILVSEWDTIYGRLFKKHIENAVGFDDKKGPCSANSKHQCPITTVNYMRGLDGEIKETTETSNRTKKDTDKSSKKNAEQNTLERPHGDRQFDYLRRLGKSLKQKNEELRIKNGKEGFPPEFKADIKAIGIIGTDIYDKLLILQALKKDFPEAIFFTTDLDANLMNPEEYSSVRNLLVVSGFGLQLQKGLQKGFPPFRGNYQTAVFLATQAAFSGNKNSLLANLKKIPSLMLKPQIFEIGHSQAINLSTHYNSIQPQRELPYTWGKFVTCYLLIVVGICVYLIFRPISRGKNSYSNHWALNSLFVTILILFFKIHTWIYINISTELTEEPLFWWEGVSVWPTNFIRLASIILSWAFILICVKRLEVSNEDLAGTYFDTDSTPTRNTDGKILLRLKRYFLFDYDHYDSSSSPLKSSKIWNDFLKHSSPIRKWIRIGFGFILLALFFAVINNLFNEVPNIPYRSDFSKETTAYIIVSAVISFLLLLLYLVDEIRLSNKLIGVLANHQIDWDDKTYQKLQIEKIQDQQIPAPDCWKLILGNWIKVRFIARLTDTVDDLIYFPFIILFLLVISRFQFFDNWNMPLPLLIFILANFLIVTFYGFRLHRTASKTKEKLLQEMNNEGIKLESKASVLHADPQWSKNKFQKLTELAERVKNETQAIRDGAFVPFWEQPILQSIMIPFSGYGGFALLEYALIR